MGNLKKRNSIKLEKSYIETLGKKSREVCRENSRREGINKEEWTTMKKGSKVLSKVQLDN